MKPITLDWLHERCVADDEHLIWQGYCCNKGRDPRGGFDCRHVNVRREIWELAHGRKVPKCHYIAAKCDRLKCVAPDCLIARSISQTHKGVPKSLTTRARIAATKREKSQLSDAAVLEIRVSDDPAGEAAARHSISLAMAKLIRQGKARLDYSDPFLRLGARNA